MIKNYFLIAAGIAIFLSNAQAADYKIDYQTSKIGFFGMHAGNLFKGTFEKWAAAIRFDPANLEASSISAEFTLDSAKTGNTLYDGTLPTVDWFDIKNHPKANFVSTSIKPKEGGKYIAEGNLTLRGVTHPVLFTFTLSDLSASPVQASGEFTLDRLAYNLGKKSDPNGEWVGKDITVTVQIQATPIP